jgi:thiol:disulfide interchange protein DsbC
MTTLRAFVALAIATVSIAAVAGQKEKDAELAATLKKTVEARFPDAHVMDVKPSPLPGIYEVFTGDAIAYVDKTGDYMFVGSLLETKTRTDLAAARLNERNAVDFNSLPLDRAIKTVKGNGERKFAVFSDPDCPYCQALEKELAQLNNYTVYTFLYPLKDLHPDAEAKAHAIWCKADRSEAWSQWMLLKKTDAAKTESQAPCDGDPVVENLALGRKLRITGTPTVYLSDGRRLDGMMEAVKLEELLNEVGKPTRTASQQPTATR